MECVVCSLYDLERLLMSIMDTELSVKKPNDVMIMLKNTENGLNVDVFAKN